MSEPLKLSVLDLAPVNTGATTRDAFLRTTELAKHAEQLGYHRFWLAEHHNMPDIASAATSTLLAHIGANTEKIRIGSGGVMLPNHAPLVVAEQYGTLHHLYGDRIDLGIGRAPGSNGVTMRALRRDPSAAEDMVPQIQSLQHFLSAAQPGQAVRAYPGVDTNIPIWLLGSSTYSALVAAKMGLPYVFASHFAPDFMEQAITLYREKFQPSEHLAQPYVMVAVNVVAAEREEQARFLATTGEQKFLSMLRGEESLIKAPVENMDAIWGINERQHVKRMLRESVIGSQAQVHAGLRGLQARTGADEIMLHSMIYDQQARLESFSLAITAQ